LQQICPRVEHHVDTAKDNPGSISDVAIMITRFWQVEHKRNPLLDDRGDDAN